MDTQHIDKTHRNAAPAKRLRARVLRHIVVAANSLYIRNSKSGALVLLDTELIGYKFTAKELADREQLPRTVWPETGRNSVVRNRRRAPRNRNRIPQPWPNRKGMTQPKLTVVKTYEPGHQNRLRAKARLKAEFLMETRRQALEAKTTKQEARR